MPKDTQFVLLRPIHFPDGTEAKALPHFPDMDRLFVEHMRGCIDRELEKSKRLDTAATVSSQASSKG